jgi:hypothetical protein
LISEELASFVESAVTMLVGTRDDDLRPEGVKGFGARVEPGREELTVFISAAHAARTLANARANERVAVCFTRPADHRSIQVKGPVLEVRDAREEERPLVERYTERLAGILGEIGIPPRLILRIARWPAYALRLRMDGVFVQTPGPGAGTPLGGPHGAAR